jgi:hypothetical protein
MANDKLDAVGGKLVGNRNALFRIGSVVSVGNCDFLAGSTPFFICAPVAALGPVMGPPTPNLT